MAVILRNGMTRTGTNTNNTLPLRSSTIKIAQTGLIESLKTDGASVQTLNLGYQGDHNVTSLYVKLWKDDLSDFINKYDAALVFYNEKSGASYTISMQESATQYSVNIPDAITQYAGNYQIYFILKESLDTGLSDGSTIGVEDDPAYREVFVSAAWKGVVSEQSGFSLIPSQFNWVNEVHNYEVGRITPFSWNPQLDEHDNPTGLLVSTVFLGGLKVNSTDDDIILKNQASIIQLEDKTLTSGEKGTTLQLTISFADNTSVAEQNKAVDDLIVEYPVDFNVNNFFEDNALHKKAINVDYKPNAIAVQDNEILGMKYDAYITPIKLNSLPNFPTSHREKYVVFAKDKQSIVCKTLDISKANQYCWIPTQVTADAGTWEVSFISKGWNVDADGNKTDEYTTYTGILKLKVVDNKLSKRDLETDTAYRALIDNEGQSLYDANSYAMYAISTTSSEVHLQYSANDINSAIGWVNGISGSQGVTPEQVINTVKDFNEVRGNYTDVVSRVGALEHTDILINNSISALSDKITEVENTVKTADVTVVKETVDQNVLDINELKTKTSTLEGKTTALENKDKTLESSISSNTSRIAKTEQDITSLKSADVVLDGRVNVLEGRANTISSILEDTVHEVDELQNRTGLLETGFESQKNYVAAQLTAEIAERTASDLELQNQLDAEISRSTTKDESLQTQLDTEKTRAETKETALQDELDQTQKDLEAEITERKAVNEAINKSIESINVTNNNQQAEISGLQSRVGSIESDSSVIRNDFINTPGTYVARIVVIKEDVENGLTAEEVFEEMVKNNEIDSSTLYLLQEEE